MCALRHGTKFDTKLANAKARLPMMQCCRLKARLRYLWMQMSAKHAAAAHALRSLPNQMTKVKERRSAVQML